MASCVESAMEVTIPNHKGEITFCWGNTHFGQLGLGGIEEEQILIPKENKRLHDKGVKHISGGENHTLFVMQDGTLYSCGDNSMGQLGHDLPNRSPNQIHSLESQHIVLACCGSAHSVAVTNKGKVFTWGDNSKGQLGCDTTEKCVRKPMYMKSLNGNIVVQVACGASHNLALTRNGKLYSWGSSDCGQLGVVVKGGYSSTPQLLASLTGLCFNVIAAGGYHSVALTTSGAIFSWGKNKFGQLGVGDEKDRQFPIQIRTLRSQKVKYVTCGEEHTVALTEDGGVFTFGAGMYGQLGHNTTNMESLPRKVFELMGSDVIQIACGRWHTMVHVHPRTYSFGLGGNGQLGGAEKVNMKTPSLVQLPLDVTPNSDKYCVHSIYAAGDQSFAISFKANDRVKVADQRESDSDKQIMLFNSDRLLQYQGMVKDEQNPSILGEVSELFSSTSCINGSFLREDESHLNCSSKNYGIDMDLAKQMFDDIGKLPNAKISQAVIDAIEKYLIPSLLESPPDVEALRLYLTVPCCHVFDKPENYQNFIYPFAKKLVSLAANPAKIIDRWWQYIPVRYFKRNVDIYKRVVIYILSQPFPKTDMEKRLRLEALKYCMETLKKLNNVNEGNGQIIPYHSFYIHELKDKVDIKKDYIEWLGKTLGKSMDGSSPYDIFFCNYPFAFDAIAKTTLLQTDAFIQMRVAVDDAQRQLFTSLFIPTINPVNPMLVLDVKRDNLVHSTLNSLAVHASNDFKKPLMVRFEGEEAVDEGGVRKEFFLLLLREVLDPKYGMFNYFDESRLLWFNPHTFEEGVMFSLIGVLCGLAIYNSVIIDLHFPLALYKKLLKRQVTLEDLSMLQPTVGRSLQQLLDYEENDVEETFCLNFQISDNVFGENISVDLIPGGANTAVNNENREKYVDSYVDYVLNKSVAGPFQAFYEGFHKVCGGRVLELFHPQELQTMVVGNEDYDWDELEKHCTYKGEYYANHPVIKAFWACFREMNVDQKKMFLAYLTGSDKIPISGMNAVKMIIQPTGGGDDFFPVAHTCFNLLDLPKYTSKEKMQPKLLEAIQVRGFGLV